MVKRKLRRLRVIDEGGRSASFNMALDDILLRLRAQDLIPDTLRFLKFSPHAVLVGYHQAVEEEVREEFCERFGIEINRRITGGGAIYFDETQIGWEIVCDISGLEIDGKLDSLSQIMSMPLIQALRGFGIRAEFRPRNDIETEGRKISGMGGTCADGRREVVLFQGTILTDFDVETMARALRVPVEKLKRKEIESFKERVVCIKEILGCLPDEEEIKGAVVEGFKQVFGYEPYQGQLSAREKSELEERIPFFSSPEWIRRVKGSHGSRKIITSFNRSKRGMIKLTCSVNLTSARLDYINVSGDFFSYPEKAILDFESFMKGCILKEEYVVSKSEEFFKEFSNGQPGPLSCLGAEDITGALRGIFAKVDLMKSGFSVGTAEKIFVVNGRFSHLCKKKPEYLLLPYCSKDVECELRYERECMKCGKCDFQQAWEIGQKAGMKVMTILNFEDLWKTLQQLKREGINYYIGCCCEAFYRKHVDDFVKSQVPGILLNIKDKTCYDLNEEVNAYRGKFERKTTVEVNLLTEVLRKTGTLGE